jgi:hypothetical protein
MKGVAIWVKRLCAATELAAAVNATAKISSGRC